MENSLKQRIIGAIVLAALAIIFLPAILKEKTSNGTFESKIPKKPQVLEEYRVDTDKIEKLNQTKVLEQQLEKKKAEAKGQEPESVRIEQVEQAAKPNARKSKKTASQAEQPKVTKAADKPIEKIKQKTKEKVVEAETLGSGFKSAAWVVQVASFSNESNAINLVEKLKKSQFKAYRRKSKADNKTVYRVYVGPFIDKPKAQDQTTAISKVSETNVVLRVFDPVKH